MEITVCAQQAKITRNLIKDFLLYFFRSEISYEDSAFNKVFRLGRVQALKLILVRM